jgi:uncharacterized protein YfaT (DUF1175 family)
MMSAWRAFTSKVSEVAADIFWDWGEGDDDADAEVFNDWFDSFVLEKLSSDAPRTWSQGDTDAVVQRLKETVADDDEDAHVFMRRVQPEMTEFIDRLRTFFEATAQ